MKLSINFYRFMVMEEWKKKFAKISMAIRSSLGLLL